MPSLKRMLTFKIRKKRRRKARDGLYVVAGNSLTPNQVYDITMGGLSFYYVDQGAKPKRTSSELALLKYNDLLVGKIPYIRVSDVESAEIMFHGNKKIKRQSVRFGRLSFSQKSRLREAIRDFT